MVAVFLKAPRLGMVKTRLGAEIGERHALQLYRLMAERALSAVRETGLDATVWFTPADALTEMREWLGEGWQFHPQCSGDLGARLAAAAREVAPGGEWMAIGADCPRLDAGGIRSAAEIIHGGSVALGPTLDGGYYLIGGRIPLPDIFSAIPWSTSAVLSETRARLVRARIVVHELPVLRDVDTAADARAEGLLT